MPNNRKLVPMNLFDRLTPEEKNHVKRGGRVFFVDISANRKYRIFIVKKDKEYKCTGVEDGYAELEWATDLAKIFANLSEDDPLVHLP